MLESIRDLLNEDAAIPPWLHDTFLGYGDPAAAHYTNMPDTLGTVDFKVGGAARGGGGRGGGWSGSGWRPG